MIFDSKELVLLTINSFQNLVQIVKYEYYIEEKEKEILLVVETVKDRKKWKQEDKAG